jgi:hypothetical protein
LVVNAAPKNDDNVRPVDRVAAAAITGYSILPENPSLRCHNENSRAAVTHRDSGCGLVSCRMEKPVQIGAAKFRAPRRTVKELRGRRPPV